MYQYQKMAVTATTVIGETIVIKGKLRGDEHLTIKGRVEADITSRKSLVIEHSGIVRANVEAENIEINGVVVGNITAKEKVEIAPNGRVVGNILAPRVIIHDGAAIRGKVDMTRAGTDHENVPRNASTQNPAVASRPPSQETGEFNGGVEPEYAETPSSVAEIVMNEEESPNPPVYPEAENTAKHFGSKRKR